MTTLTFKVLSALLGYPTEELKAAVPQLIVALDAEALVPKSVRRQLDILLDEIATHDLLDLQERYVFLFDRTRSLSLHIFEHVHGESRDRGQAMIDLKNHYENAGFEMTASELPDFVPLFLEFLSTQDRAQAYDLLAQPAHIFSALAERLRKRQSPYEAVFRCLVALAAAKPKGEDDQGQPLHLLTLLDFITDQAPGACGIVYCLSRCVVVGVGRSVHRECADDGTGERLFAVGWVGGTFLVLGC